MPRPFLVLALFVSLSPAWPQAAASLRGTITDPSGAAVPGAVIQLRGPGGERRTKTGNTGRYSFPSLARGKYQIRVIAKGFSVTEKIDLPIDRAASFDAQLTIRGEKQVLNVGDETDRVSPEPGSNGSLIMRERQLAVLSDDPDELALQLQALAGPAPGPNGGEMFIDGFSGGNLPPKSSIREVRINANPFSPEYDRPGFARVEIFTKPGADTIRGQAFAQFNNDSLNSRNPLLAQSTRPPYQAQFYGLNLSGPLSRNKASFTLDIEHRKIDENAFILATTLDGGLDPVKINQAVATPQSRTTIRPRIDYALNPRNALALRYQDLGINLDNQGIGDFNLASRAYNERQTDRTVQITETAMISPRAIDETRFQYLRSVLRDASGETRPAINVQGAFYAGGATVGNSAKTTNGWELTNVFIFAKRKHTLKWGGRVRQSLVADTSVLNFAGVFTFYSLAQYQKTLALQQAGYTGTQIVQLGAGPSQFNMNAGTPAANVNQTDAGLFVNDDWRARPNLTLSYGLRYEAQNNHGDLSDWAPRVGIAWGLDGTSKRPAKTVLRAGFGIFYERIPISVTLNAFRYDGTTQQSYLILNPTFFPTIPTPEVLQAEREPQQLQPVYSGIRAPRIYQTSFGIDRQLNSSSRFSVNWISSRGVHLLNTRNINAPINSVYPWGDRSIRLLTESAGLSRLNQVVANANVNYRRLFLFGYYSLSYGKDNNEGLPADPYNLRAEWGPSAYGDVRHRAVAGTTIPMRWKFNVSPFLMAFSGQPYNITTGLDPYNTGYPAARPALLSGGAASGCQGDSLMYAAGFGCFNLQPAPGSPAIERNYGRGPAEVNLALRISRTWGFGGERQTGTAVENGGGHDGGMGPSGTNTGKRYNVMLSASTLNALNHANFAPPNGVLSSPYFGQYRSLGGLIVMSHGGAPSTYNRKIDLQLRFTF